MKLLYDGKERELSPIEMQKVAECISRGQKSVMLGSMICYLPDTEDCDLKEVDESD